MPGFLLALLLAVPAEPMLPAVLTLPDALRLFRERSFDLLLADAQIATARAEQATAGAIPNPALSGSVGHSFGYDPSLCPGCSAVSIAAGISDQAAISDLLSGKRGLRMDAARAAAEAARLSRDDAERLLRTSLQQAVVDAALQRAQLDLAAELLEFAEQTEQLNQTRYRTGAISEAELARAQVAALEAGQAVDVARQSDRAARAGVAFLLAVRGPLPDFRIDPDLLEQAARLSLPAADEGALLAAAAETRPDLRALEKQEARARAALALARRQRIPEVTLSAQYSQEGTGNSAVSPPTLAFGASLPLPIFYRQQGEVQRAEADLRTQLVQRDKAAAQLASEVVTAYGAFAASRKLVDRMRGGLLERAQRARDLTRIQYEKGAARLFELLDAQRAFAQVRGEYLQDLHDLWLNLFKLEAAVGKELRS
ncbi:MAG TPA: TolC family protein [Myxococcales bacterium]|nr:TolC family protein [Myxococcales bacterium]